MLVLTCRPGESILIRDGARTITVTVLRIAHNPLQKLADVVIGEPGAVRFATLSFDRPEPVSRTLTVVLTDLQADRARFGFAGDKSTPIWRADVLIASAGTPRAGVSVLKK